MSNQYESDDAECMMIMKKIEMYCYDLVFDELCFGFDALKNRIDDLGMAMNDMNEDCE